MLLLIFFINLIHLNSAKDLITIEFVKEFVKNDKKPTNLVYIGLCWNKSTEVKFVKEMFKMGIKASSKYLETTDNFQEHTLLFLVDLECPDSTDVLFMASSKQLFRLGYRWLVLTNVSNEDNRSLENLYMSPLLPDSDLVIAERSGDYFTMVELHRPALNFTMQMLPRGHFNGSLVDVRPHRELFKRRRDLLGHGLIMANVIQDSNSTKYHLPLEDRQQLQYDAVSKVCWVYAKLAFEMLNATPRYIYSYRWGYQLNGSWSGMIYDVHARRADLGTNCIIFRDRLDMVTFADKVAPLRMRFVFRQPPLSYASNIFYMPFTTGVWVAIGVCAAICTGMLYLASKWELKYEKSPYQLDGSIADALLLTVSAVTQQGCFIEPRRAPGRIMEWFFFAALMALYAAYSANIVVLLQTSSNSIQTLRQLSDSKITLAANDVDYNRFVFNSYQDPLHSSVHKRVIPDERKPLFYNTFDGVERIRKGLFAFHSVVEPVYRRIQDTFQENEKCDVTEVDFLNNFDAFTPMRKDSPYLELIRVAYKQIREAGFKHVLNDRFQATKPRCMSRIVTFTSVSLLDTQPVLNMMLYGVLLSILVTILEIIVFKISSEREKFRHKT